MYIFNLPDPISDLVKKTFCYNRFRCITIPLCIKHNCLTGLCFNNNIICIYSLVYNDLRLTVKMAGDINSQFIISYVKYVN